MIKVAIVDDNEVFLQEMKREVESSGEFTEGMACDTYADGMEFLQTDNGAYQLVILDMQMEGIGGYGIAEKLRERDKFAVIAFVSGVVLPKPEHFRVQPYRYLIKGSDTDRMRRDIEELLQETKRRSLNETVEVVRDGEARRVFIRNIIYIEKARRGSLLTMEDNGAGGGTVLQSNERLEGWYLQLCTYGFEYAHTSYLVNLRAVTKIVKNELTMSNGDRLGISRTCSGKFHQRFSMFFYKKYKRGDCK